MFTDAQQLQRSDACDSAFRGKGTVHGSLMSIVRWTVWSVAAVRACVRTFPSDLQHSLEQAKTRVRDLQGAHDKVKAEVDRVSKDLSRLQVPSTDGQQAPALGMALTPLATVLDGSLRCSRVVGVRVRVVAGRGGGAPNQGTSTQLQTDVNRKRTEISQLRRDIDVRSVRLAAQLRPDEADLALARPALGGGSHPDPGHAGRRRSTGPDPRVRARDAGAFRRR